MITSSTLRLVVLGASLAGSATVFAQHSGHAGHGQSAQQSHGSASASAPTHYAGQQQRAIKALSDKDVQDLMEGKGMGLALAAELNSYPGPMHVLENAQALGLSDTQRSSTAQLMSTHKEEVRTLGRQLVEVERELDQAFASRQIDSPSLTARMQRIGALQAAIRDAHLQTHLRQTALLTAAQVAQYNQLRGYGTSAAASHKH
ncbi:periplasmic heavy metal sensor [Polaromonas sp. YR568]|uniref:Spy/CpxP family protein refolding chaperone n=1 Tax=Polaromonas sp. YR568 TaxID=1855301 RepID=UPI0031379831